MALQYARVVSGESCSLPPESDSIMTTIMERWHCSMLEWSVVSGLLIFSQQYTDYTNTSSARQYIIITIIYTQLKVDRNTYNKISHNDFFLNISTVTYLSWLFDNSFVL